MSSRRPSAVDFRVIELDAREAKNSIRSPHMPIGKPAPPPTSLNRPLRECLQTRRLASSVRLKTLSLDPDRVPVRLRASEEPESRSQDRSNKPAVNRPPSGSTCRTMSTWLVPSGRLSRRLISNPFSGAKSGPCVPNNSPQKRETLRTTCRDNRDYHGPDD